MDRPPKEKEEEMAMTKEQKKNKVGGIFAIEDDHLKWQMLKVNDSGKRCEDLKDFMQEVFSLEGKKDTKSNRFIVTFLPAGFDFELENELGVASAVDAAQGYVDLTYEGWTVLVWDKKLRLCYSIEQNEYIYSGVIAALEKAAAPHLAPAKATGSQKEFYIITYSHGDGVDAWPHFGEPPETADIIADMRKDGRWAEIDDKEKSWIGVTGPFPEKQDVAESGATSATTTGDLLTEIESAKRRLWSHLSTEVETFLPLDVIDNRSMWWSGRPTSDGMRWGESQDPIEWDEDVLEVLQVIVRDELTFVWYKDARADIGYDLQWAVFSSGRIVDQEG